MKMTVKTRIFLLSAIAFAVLPVLSEEKRDLTEMPAEFKDKSAKPRDWTKRTNPLFTLDTEGVDEIHLAYQGEATPELVLSNRTDVVLSLRGKIRLSTFRGRGFDLDASGELPAHGIRRIVIGRALEKGSWLAVAELGTDEAKAVAETRFAVVRRREIRPAAANGEFRPGINYHMGRYSDEVNELCLRALVQAGARLVRANVGAAFVEVEGKEGEFDWRKPDRNIEKLERRGLALDTGFYAPPSWALDEKHRDVKARWMAPAKPGKLRTYAEALASRYGTRIAWYEVGNEWDLASPETITTDEAIAMQREAYEGIKAGCPAAQVIPNGWAVAHSDVLPHRTQRNMQERMMTEVKDAYDAHPMHQHGPYREYRRRMTEFFAWRKHRGIDDKPWYANETSQTTMHAGEDVVAECVWQKMIYAWAHGSVDYIWYNLRASGFGPYDGEQGYGLMTGDFYPRMTFAAFAGFTSCFDGFAPAEIVHDGVSRELYRFAADWRQLLVGWDTKAKERYSVRVKTDAAAAYAVDIFDNRRKLEVRDGMVEMRFFSSPMALLLEGATFATADADDLKRGETADVALVKLGKQGCKFQLNSYDKVFEMYKADPANFDRIWKGGKDLSGHVVVKRDGEMAEVIAWMNDDKVAEGDRMVVIVDGVASGYAVNFSTNVTVNYHAKFPMPKPEAVWEIRIEDDDGLGKEGWMTTDKFKVELEPFKECSESVMSNKEQK